MSSSLPQAPASLGVEPGARPDVLVARQPIYDRLLRVAGYELVVESPAGDAAGAARAMAEVGLNLVVGRLAYVPVSHAFLDTDLTTVLPPDRVVLKVPPHLGDDTEAIAELRALRRAGYSLMLDRFSYDAPTRSLLGAARVVGIDVSGGAGAIRPVIAELRRGGDVKLLAQNVEDHDQLDFCLADHFDLLQGYFFCRPRIVSEQGVEVGRLGAARLAAALHSQSVDFDSIQEIISRDVGLSYNLLRFINSAFFSLPRRVDSIRDTLALLGVENVRRWATLMALTNVGDKPPELVVTGLVRARMCELIARDYGYDDADGFFTTGLFSVVDALTDTSMVELLASLPLTQEVIVALLNYDGAKGRVLRAVVAYERGNFAELADMAPTATPLAELYSQAVEWATDASGAVSH